MRIVFFLFLGLLGPLTLLGQQSEVQLNAKKITLEWDGYYQFNTEQKEAVLSLQEAYFTKLNEIKDLEQKNIDVFLIKKNTLREMRADATFNLLNEQQRKKFQQLQAEREKRKAALKAELKQKGASVEEIKRAMMSIE